MRGLKIALFVLLLGIGLSVQAQQECLCDDGTTSVNCCPPGDPVPISGLEFLLGAGALYGVKRLLDKRKKP